MNGKRTALTAGIYLWSAFYAFAANPPVPESAPQIVTALLRNPPQTLSDLETLAGPISRDRSNWDEAMGPFARARAGGVLAGLRVQLAIDFYHQDPRQVENPRLASYDLHFRAGRRACRSLLETLAGSPQTLSDNGIRVLRFKDFYFRETGTADGFTLSWFQEEPDFAVPLRSAEETKSLVSGLAALLRKGISREAVERHLGALKPDGEGEEVSKGADWEIRVEPGKGQAVERIVFFTRRPIPGDLLVEALRLKEPGVLQSCLHECSRTVVDLAVSGRPQAHGYEVRIELDRAADLVAVDRPLRPGSVFLARDYPVESVVITRSRQAVSSPADPPPAGARRATSRRPGPSR